MKKILITILLLKCFCFAENETIIINDEENFFRIMIEQMGEIKNKYNLEIEVLISIDENGVFNYKILKESDIEKFNEEVIIFLEEKRKIKFPTLKNKKKSFKTKFKAEPKEEEKIYKNIRDLKN